MAELIILGSASAVPTADRFSTSLAVKSGSRIVLLDCGAPVSTLLPRCGENPLAVSAVCLSHWHADHVAGLPLFLLQVRLMGRQHPLAIYGPPASERKLDQVLEAYFLKRAKFPYPINVTEVKVDRRYDLGPGAVTFFPTSHFEQPEGYRSEWNPEERVALGMVVEVDGRRIVYSGDCGQPEDLASYVDGCDVLLHEFAHHSLESIAEFAEAHHVPHLLICHIHPDWCDRPEAIQAELCKRFGGRITVAEDGLRIPL